MKNRKVTSEMSVLVALVFMFTIASAHAAEAEEIRLLRTYVASGGNDLNNCSRDTPCRTFAGAVPKTAAGGEITALDTGEYGNVNINKSLTLVAAPGVSAVLDAGPNDLSAVSIDAGPADVVVLRNLYITHGTRSAGSQDGVTTNSGVGTLYVEGCVIRGWGGTGILVDASSSADERGVHTRLFVSDTAVSDCEDGISLSAFGSSSLQTSIEHCRLENNRNAGLVSTNLAKTTVRNTVASGNEFGFRNLSGQATGQLSIANCEASNNHTGIENHWGLVRVSGSIVTNNSDFGFLNLPGGAQIGTFQSVGDNVVRGNGKNTEGPITNINGT